jgi:signal transduction histidine kinase
VASPADEISRGASLRAEVFQDMPPPPGDYVKPPMRGTMAANYNIRRFGEWRAAKRAREELKMRAGAGTYLPHFVTESLRPNMTAFWLTAVVYSIAYLFINTVTDSHQFVRSGITLWSPDNGLSLLIIMESSLFVPLVVFNAVISDIFIHHVGNSLATTLECETTLTLGYFLISVILRDGFKFSIRDIKFDNILVVVTVLPATAAFTMILYCGILYFSGSLSLADFGIAAYQFWLGDTVGMVVVIPAAIALYDILNNRRWRQNIKAKDFFLLVILLIFLFEFTFVSASKLENHHFFYLIFIPIIWVSIKYGYVGSALSLLVTQIFVIGALTYFHVNDDQFSVFQTLMFVLSATGLLLGVVITERKQTERLLRDQRAELARVGARVAAGAMASTVAHEISQPLSAMTIYVHGACLILDNAEGGRTEQTIAEARAALADAEAQGERTRAIIERVRDFVAGGKLMLESLDPVQLVEKICQLSAEEAQDRGVTLSVEPHAPMPTLRADRIAIEQAVNNLVTNAVDSAAGRGDASGRVAIRLAQRDNLLLIEVEDNGAGVAPEVADKLFETFETTKVHGMGLGLPLARQVALSQSGSLTWRPIAPQGASFTMALPIHGPE